MEDQDLPATTTKDFSREIELQRACSSCDAVCGLSKQSNHRSESESRTKSSKKLGGLIVLCIIFIVVEIIGGVKANSLAVLTDAAHLLTDVTGFSISLFAVWASGWDATPRHSFGFFRLEVLGALLSVQLIWLIVGFLIYEAINRILTGNVLVNGKLMFLTATIGFSINLVMVTWLGHGHDHGHHHGCGGHKQHGCHETEEDLEEKPLVSNPANAHHIHSDHQLQNHHSIVNWMSLPFKQLNQTHINMNVQSAYLHVMGDLIQSIGVMIGGALIWAKPNWLAVDLVCTLGFSVLVLLTTISMIKDILFILMESTPSEIDVPELETGLSHIRGVQAVHDLHVWAISVGRNLLSCHVQAEKGANSSEILRKTREYCEKVHGIHHATIQIEYD